ncbi:hypothetical protein V8E54_015148 [Elaphomyces granulatus]
MVVYSPLDAVSRRDSRADWTTSYVHLMLNMGLASEVVYSVANAIPLSLYATTREVAMDFMNSIMSITCTNSATLPTSAPKYVGGSKPVLDLDGHGLLTLLIFNIAYDTGIFPSERQRVELSVIYCSSVIQEDALAKKSRLLSGQAVRKLLRGLLAAVSHPETSKDVLVMAVKLVHHKGEDRKPKVRHRTVSAKIHVADIVTANSGKIGGGKLKEQS